MSWTADKTGWLLALGGAVAGFLAVRLCGHRGPVTNPGYPYSGLLFIEPKNPASIHPVVDELTQRMAAALNDGTRKGCWKGVHTCVCGAESTNCNYLLSDGQVTNSLAVHYLAYHRDEVPKSELRKVRNLPEQGTEPTRRQLRGHGRMKSRAQIKSVTRPPRVVTHRYVRYVERKPKRHG